MRSTLHHVGISDGLLSHAVHDVDEVVECLLRLGLRGLDHDALVEEQGEVDRGRMVAIVEQALGDVERGHAGALVGQAVEDKLVLAHRVDGQVVGIAQALLHIVGGERSDGTHMLDLLTQREDIGVGTHHDGKVAQEGGHSSAGRV